eukprot:jgi/Antlo1/191/925
MNDPTLFLAMCLEEVVLVTCKEMEQVECVLHAFDEHSNILVTKKGNEGEILFIRGETIACVQKRKCPETR